MKNTVADSKKRAERMKDQLRRRQERGSKRAVAGVENLSDVERKQAAAITNLMTEADRTREENSLIAALKALEEVRPPSARPRRSHILCAKPCCLSSINMPLLELCVDVIALALCYCQV